MSQQILLIWFLSLVVKIILATFLPLSPDECYYWVWSHNLQFSYFDHPPMVAIFFWLGHIFENFYHAVRLPSVVLSHFGLLIWLSISKPLLNTPQQIIFILLFLFSPLLGFGSLIITPDLPLMLFWALATYFFIKLELKQTAFYYLIFGITLGLGGLSKYHMILFPIIILIYLFLNKKSSILFNRHTLLAISAALIVISPVIYWNYKNNFVSFRFQMEHGFKTEKFSVQYITDYLIGQGALLFFVFLVLGVKKSLKDIKSLLSLMSIFPMTFFLFSSFKAHVEMNWPVVAHPSLLLKAISTNVKKIYIIFYIAIFGSLFTVISYQAISGQKNVLHDKISEYSKIDEFAAKITDYQPIYASSYQLASTLWYINKKPIYKLHLANRRDFFDDLTITIPTEKMFYFVYDSNNKFPDWLIEKNYIITQQAVYNSQYSLYKVEQKYE